MHVFYMKALLFSLISMYYLQHLCAGHLFVIIVMCMIPLLDQDSFAIV